MKKFILLCSCILLVANLNAQAPRYALFEEFTNSSCVPCAQANPGFEANILKPNPSTVRQISYHVNWPSPYDPMYLADQADLDERIYYYFVTGVPDAVLLGNVKEQSPAAYTQADVDAITSQTSPTKIKVMDVDNGSFHDVTVTVTSVGAPPAGTFKLRNAVIQRDYNWSNPGGNGETYFPNVCKKMLPNATGDDIVLPAMGSSVTFTYTYAEDPFSHMVKTDVISFLQNTSTKEIVNCGSSFDPDASIPDPAVLTHGGITGNASSFNISCNNNGITTENFSLTLSNNAPADWSSGFSVNGNTYESSAQVVLNAGASVTVTINVTPGATPAIGCYTLTVTSINDPNQDPVIKSVYVFRGITDLIVNAAGTQGDGTGVTPDSWQANFVNGLTNAGCSTFSVIGASVANRAATENSLADVKDIYYNVGWAFPAFTDGWVANLETLMNSGVNLFICGQDIGWDVWTPSSGFGHSTPASEDFYTNYLFSAWNDDGGSANSLLTASVGDAVFGDFSNLAIIPYYGGTFFYPDEISPVGIGLPIFYYNNSTRVAGVRADNGTFKMVYLAPGLEMLSSANANSMMNSVYDWFHGITAVQEVDPAFQLVGNNYPNPSDDITCIPVSGLKSRATLILTDLLGHVLKTQEVDAGTFLLVIKTSDLPQGIYQYYLIGEEKSTVHTLQAIH